jgi:hypothetical protein
VATLAVGSQNVAEVGGIDSAEAEQIAAEENQTVAETDYMNFVKEHSSSGNSNEEQHVEQQDGA